MDWSGKYTSGLSHGEVLFSQALVSVSENLSMGNFFRSEWEIFYKSKYQSPVDTFINSSVYRWSLAHILP